MSNGSIGSYIGDEENLKLTPTRLTNEGSSFGTTLKVLESTNKDHLLRIVMQ